MADISILTEGSAFTSGGLPGSISIPLESRRDVSISGVLADISGAAVVDGTGRIVVFNYDVSETVLFNPWGSDFDAKA